MKKNGAKKERKEHQKALKPLLKHLKSDEKKMNKKRKGANEKGFKQGQS